MAPFESPHERESGCFEPGWVKGCALETLLARDVTGASIARIVLTM